jgi:hypothetical protein
VILLTGSATDADCTYDLAVHPDGYAPRKDHDATVIRYMNAEELAARLRMLCEVLGCNIECTRRERFIDRDIDASDPRSIHPNMCYQIAALIHYRDIHRLTDLCGFFLGCRDHFAREGKIHHCCLYPPDEITAHWLDPVCGLERRSPEPEAEVGFEREFRAINRGQMDRRGDDIVSYR